MIQRIHHHFPQVAVYAKAAGGGGGGITFAGTDAQGGNPVFGVFTFPSVNFGPASSDRIIVVAQMEDSTGTAIAPTIGGVTSTFIGDDGNTTPHLSFWYANVPTGTSGSVVMNTTGASTVSIAVGALHGQSGGGSVAPTSTANFNNIQLQPSGPIALTVPTGGIGVFVAAAANVGVTTTPVFTWTGVTSTSGDVTGFTTSGATSEISMAHSTASGSATASSTFDMSFGGVMVAASWAP